jgi:hypothetical protein
LKKAALSVTSVASTNADDKNFGEIFVSYPLIGYSLLGFEV